MNFVCASSRARLALSSAFCSSTALDRRPAASTNSFFMRTASSQRDTRSVRFLICPCQYVCCSSCTHMSSRFISLSASIRATFAASANLNSERRRNLSCSMFSTLAGPAAISVSALLEVFLNQGRLLSQEAHVLVRGFHEVGKHLHSLLEGFRELPLLLVAPRGFQAAQAAVQARDQALKLVVEAIQVG